MGLEAQGSMIQEIGWNSVSKKYLRNNFEVLDPDLVLTYLR